jgi:signal transduction histidine kinase
VAAVFGGFVDITDRKETLRKLEAAGREQYEQVKRIAGSLAHEIYNSLFPATSSLHKLRERLDTASTEEAARNRRLLELAELSVQRAIDMTGLVKRYSHLELEKSDEKVLLEPLVQEVVKANLSRIEETGVGVAIELSDGLALNMNRLHAFSLFNNLMANAVKFLAGCHEKRVTVSGLRLPDGRCRIAFQDTGPGIAIHQREVVFQAFYSTDPATGTGLGLAMVKKIVELYGGEISVGGEVDVGAEFVILMPPEIASGE